MWLATILVAFPHILSSLFLVRVYSVYTHFVLTVHSLYTHYILTVYSLYTHYILTIYSLYTHCILTIYSLYTHYILTIYSLYTPHCILTVYYILYTHYCTFTYPGAGCQLLARDLKSDASLTVNGHDGVHDTVQSTVNVKVKPYTNRTLDSTIVTRVSGVSIEEFVELSELFISSVEEFTFNGESVRLLSMRSTGNYIDLYLVLETADGSPSTSLASLLSANKEDISRKSGVTVSTSRRNVCTVASCSGNGDCRSQVVVFDQLDYTSTASLTLTYQLASLQPLCVCEPQYIGESCSDEAKACISSPCMHGARCLPVGESDFQCVCTEFWQGAQCEKDVDECLDPDTCLNGGSCTNVEGSFQCGCTEHYRGVRCEERIRCETRNPCHQTATCVGECVV